MKFYGEPNHLVTKEGKPFFTFDENGGFDLDKWVEEYKQKIISELKKHFRFDEEESEEKPTKLIKCKVCSEEFSNTGAFLAHTKSAHKKG